MTWLVYRSGSGREDNLTPRMIKDTVGKPGQSPGLSTYTALELAVPPGGKAQVIDLDLLQLPLRGWRINRFLKVDARGTSRSLPQPRMAKSTGHSWRNAEPLDILAIIAEADGEVDRALLEEWAATRGTDQVHRLTEIVQQALVATVRRPR